MKLSRLPLILPLLALVAVNPAGASQWYVSQGLFLADLGGTPSVHNYDALGHNTTLTNQLPGATYGSTARAWDAQSQGGGGTYHTPINVALNFGANPIVIQFSTPVDGVGFFNTSLFDAEQATFFDAANNILFQANLAMSPVNFTGYISTTVKIAKVSVVGIAPTNGTIFIDTLTFGNLAPVATSPSSWSRIKSLLGGS